MKGKAHRLRGRLAALTISAFISLPALAEHCVFQLYSDYLGYALKACQTASKSSECGTWPTLGQTKRPMAFAEDKQKSRLVMREGDCPRERVVGVCKLPESDLIFYEGKPADIEKGCGHMQGVWEPKQRAP